MNRCVRTQVKRKLGSGDVIAEQLNQKAVTVAPGLHARATNGRGRRLMKLFTAALATSLMMGSAIAQSISPNAQVHLDAARAAAGKDHQAVLKTVCDGAVAFADYAPPRAARPAGAASGPPPESEWYAQPQK